LRTGSDLAILWSDRLDLNLRPHIAELEQVTQIITTRQTPPQWPKHSTSIGGGTSSFAVAKHSVGARHRRRLAESLPELDIIRLRAAVSLHLEDVRESWARIVSDPCGGRSGGRMSPERGM